MKSIPFNDLAPAMSGLTEQLYATLQAIFQSGYFIEGPFVRKFESEFAAYIGCPFATAVGNGTDALEIALRVAGVGAGDEVVTVANAGGYTTTACIGIGAHPAM